MKLLCIFLITLAVLAVTEARPRRKYKFTKGNSGTSGRAGGDDTSVDTESKVNAGDSGNFAMSKGLGSARGVGESSVDLESWAGFEEWIGGGAGGGGRAIGDETSVDTDSEVYIGENGAQANANSLGGARGTGMSAIDLDAFGGLDGWSSGSASGGGKAEGDLSEVDSQSSVNSELGKGTMAKSHGKGAARSDGSLASVKLEHIAGIDETGTSGKSSATAIGNKAYGKSGSSSLHGADGAIEVGSESEAGAEAFGRGGSRTGAEAGDGQGFGVKAQSEGRGEGDLVTSESGSKTGLTRNHAAGTSFSKTSSRGRGQSFSESGASVNIGAGGPVGGPAAAVSGSDAAGGAAAAPAVPPEDC